MKKYLLLFLLPMISSCGIFEGKKEEPTDLKKEFINTTSIVDTIHLREKSFQSELISNGKLRAMQKSDLRFSGSGRIEELRVQNGASVVKGSTIAVLDNRTQKLDLVRSGQRLEKAKMDLQDALFGFGYTTNDTTLVNSEHLRVAKLRSGYGSAVSDLESAKMNLEATILKAPFSGKIANLKTKIHENPKGEFFCTVINDNSFDVEFPILESELQNVRVNQSVMVATYTESAKKHKGIVKGINPSVDEKGQIMVTANIPNNGVLMDGMNVKVYIENSIPSKLVVPKSAMLIRDNLEVIFRMSKEGKAMWTYVVIEASNSSSYVVSANKDRGADLQAGDIVIISGNLNLADNVEVVIKKH